MANAPIASSVSPRPEPHSFGAGLTELDVVRFQTILSEACGLKVGLPEAWSRAIGLLSLVEMLLEADGAHAGAELSTGVRARSHLTDSPS